MDILTFLHANPELFIFGIGLFALLIGSFLNVVISRLPITLKQDWRKDCYEYLEIAIPPSEQQEFSDRINLLLPRSHCPVCKHTLRAIDNIPIISYIILAGKCHFCSKKIAMKYPLVELLACALCAFVAWHFGVSWQTIAGCIFTFVLIVQSWIDIEHKMIPDEITMPFLWLGLFLSLFDIFTDPVSSIIGAITGYLILWVIYWIFFLATKKEGMGYGDFKLLAMLSAWLGWQIIPFIIVFSSVLGSLAGIMILLFTKHDRNTRIPFGPFLAVAGWIAMLWGPDINYWYLNYFGIAL